MINFGFWRYVAQLIGSFWCDRTAGKRRKSVWPRNGWSHPHRCKDLQPDVTSKGHHRETSGGDSTSVWACLGKKATSTVWEVQHTCHVGFWLEHIEYHEWQGKKGLLQRVMFTKRQGLALAFDATSRGKRFDILLREQGLPSCLYNGATLPSKKSQQKRLASCRLGVTKSAHAEQSTWPKPWMPKWICRAAVGQVWSGQRSCHFLDQ